MMNVKLGILNDRRSSILLYSYLFIVSIYFFSCSAYIISPGIRSDNALTNIEKPPVIRNDKIKNDNLSVSVFIPKEEDLEEAFFDENNFSPENENLRNILTPLWERAKETKNVVLVQTEDRKNKENIRQIKSIHLKLKDCEPIKSITYQYNFIKFVRFRNRVRSVTIYPKLPESAYLEEMQPIAANFSMNEIPTLRSIFIFEKKCIIGLQSLVEVKIETDETLIFKFQNAK
ncbi:MAG TPA: hypothetical protein PLX69_15685 [Leptospiraceae bacterium]|nr:hypothetical protein [Leptospiraceae bacterium]